MPEQNEKRRYKVVSDKINEHYGKIQRDLPWRKTKDPYLIWLSEVILQQTRVEQGLPYYLAISKRFPDVASLARASEEEVLKLWQGLGYYSRARNMHAAAQQVYGSSLNIFPSKFDALMELKGVGPYTASAIASICSNEAVAAVDGNVIRVIARVFGVFDPKDSTEGSKKIKEIAELLLNKADPGKHNQAMMEFGALVCRPGTPDCENCPLQNSCYAYQNEKVEVLPVKGKKTKRKARFFYYFDIELNSGFLLEQRMGKDIWKNMYQLPLIELNGPNRVEEAYGSFLGSLKLSSRDLILQGHTDPIKHVLSHQDLFIIFIRLAKVANLSKGIFDKYTIERDTVPIKKPLPKPIAEYLDKRVISVDHTSTEAS